MKKENIFNYLLISFVGMNITFFIDNFPPAVTGFFLGCFITSLLFSFYLYRKEQKKDVIKKNKEVKKQRLEIERKIADHERKKRSSF